MNRIVLWVSVVSGITCRNRWLAAVILQCSVLTAFAANPNPLAGRSVVVGGTNAKVTPCFPCHGLDGVGDGSGAFPRLTGQPAFYLYKQLMDYASGSRPNAIMSPIAKELDPQQMLDVAAYYATLKAPYRPPPEVDPQLLEQGRRLADPDQAEPDQACAYCHGDNGKGMGPSFPYLAGQYAPYTEFQLQLWQRKQRRNDPFNVMAHIARRLNDDDIKALALYFETLRPGDDTRDTASGSVSTIQEALDRARSR